MFTTGEGAMQASRVGSKNRCRWSLGVRWGGAISLWVVSLLLRPEVGLAQCTWSGTFQTTFDITMTLSETSGQVSGSYTFDNGASSGTISGTVRTDNPGYTILDGYWREPNEGGRLSFTMPLDPCTQFTGQYTADDVSDQWIAGWDGTRTSGTITLYSATTEKHLAQMTDEEGNLITLLGTRDELGTPSTLESVFVQAPGEVGSSDGTFLHVDEQSRPSRILGTDGTVIKLDWQSSPTVVVSAISADGSVQVNTDVPLSPDALPSLNVVARDADSGAKIVTDVQDQDVFEARQSSSDSVLVIVGVSSACGGTPTINEVLDVNVLVDNTWYNAASQGEGRYSVVIPLAAFAPPADPANVKQVCDGLGNILARACKDANYAAQLETDVCQGLSAAFDANIAAANAKGSVLNQCQKAFKGLKGICYMAATGIINTNPTPADASNFVCSNLKDYIEVAVAPGATPNASATAYIEGTGYVMSSGTVDLLNAYATGMPARLSIQAPTQNPAVLSVTVTPSNPGADMGYTVQATVNCTANHKLILSVVGSDGYTNNSVLISDQKVDTVEISVPGGVGGVQDIITLSIDDVVVRTTSLVFGF